MKLRFKLAMLGIFALVISTTAQTKPEVWPEMKNFHSFMSSTFHPSEEGNLAPLRAKADSMFMAAKQWQAAAIPASYKPKETKAALEKLVKQCAEIKASVASNTTDDELKKLIANAHDVFHTIVKECRKEEEKQ